MEIMDKKFTFALAAIPLSLVSIFSYATTDSNELDTSNITSPPPLLLARNYKAEVEISKFLISEKLDGVRAYWDGRHLITRGGHIINAPDWFTKDFPTIELDGELWLGRKQFEKLSGIVRKHQPIDDEWHLVKYVIFDLPKDLATFEQRYLKLQSLKTKTSSRYLTLVKQISLNFKLELDEYLAQIMAKDGEGLMLHRKDSLYQAKRSFDLQKMKPFDDDEAIVVAHIKGKGKYKNMLGAIEVINKEGIQFKIGSGFSLQERLDPPPLNSEITYRYRGKTNKNTPRFATFLRMKIIE